ncbi:MAG: hypothetical protein QOH63_2987, partial [Acidobacteriota bacterium]|nr:hypothetical protein [Acidobacteriota bacterium]
TLEAAQLLGVTTRQVRRLRYRFINADLSSLLHGNTGRVPVNAALHIYSEKAA